MILAMATSPTNRALKKSTLTPIHRILAIHIEKGWLCLSCCLENKKQDWVLILHQLSLLVSWLVGWLVIVAAAAAACLDGWFIKCVNQLIFVTPII